VASGPDRVGIDRSSSDEGLEGMKEVGLLISEGVPTGGIEPDKVGEVPGIF